MSLALAQPLSDAPPRLAHVIVVGNEKGGSGKSTVAMHLAVALMRMAGARAASISMYVSAP